MKSTKARQSTVATTRGAAALVAADGSHPEHECVIGELVWTSELCDDLPCQCGFNGAASGGVTTIAEVRRLRGVTPGDLQRVLVDAMTAEGHDATCATTRVGALLALARRLTDGTLVRLEHGVPVPFPPGSRVVARGRVVSPAPRSRR